MAASKKIKCVWKKKEKESRNFIVQVRTTFREISWSLSHRPVKGPLAEWFTFTFWILALCLICLCLVVQESQEPGSCVLNEGVG